MRWRDIGDVPCSVARTLSVIGDRWTLLVLRDAFLRTRRFGEFQEHLGIARHLLADRLRKLVDHGILERRVYATRPRRYEYRLTAKGLDLYPVLVALVGWGDRWMGDENGPPVELAHRRCGSVGVPRLVCPGCGERVGARDMKARPSVALLGVLHRLSDTATDPSSRTSGSGGTP